MDNRLNYKKRKKAHQAGKIAEFIAALWLRMKFYQILARNWRSPYGEADIIAQRGKKLIIVEVKKRRDKEEVIEAIQSRQKERLMRVGLHFQTRYRRYSDHDLRFDAILVTPFSLRHIENAWWQDG